MANKKELKKKKKIEAIKKMAEKVKTGADALQEGVAVASHGSKNFMQTYVMPDRVIVGSNSPTNYEEAREHAIKSKQAAINGSNDIRVENNMDPGISNYRKKKRSGISTV